MTTIITNMQSVPTIGLVSLGCAKNLVDTQRLTSALVAMGYEISASYDDCDLVVVNTCGFINPAVQESLDAITEALNSNGKVIVMGCLGARPETITSHCPRVLKVFGPGRRAAVLREIVKLLGHPPNERVQKLHGSGILLTPNHYAYLKIAEGCRHSCTFCIIPSLRGTLRSRRPHDILREAYDLKSRGVRELLVIAQDSSDYGSDLKDGNNITSLCRELGRLDMWVRLHYVYPSREVTELVRLMRDQLILPYLDVPLQHVSKKILRRMKRPGDIEQTLKNIESWRKICPDLAIRSTFIVGFPGETDENFKELLDFLKEAQLDRVGCFPYSRVEGARANTFPDAVPEHVAEQRAGELMALQEKISSAKLKKRIGNTCDVIIDEVTDEGCAVGRSKYEAPDVDGVIYIQNAKELKIGQIAKVKITGSDEHDLEGDLDSSFNSLIRFVEK